MYEGMKGEYEVSNVDKCINGKSIKYKSKYEQRMMTYLDTSSSILKWGYEVLHILYISPSDGKEHKYEVDFYVEAIAVDDSIKKIAIEVKPLKQVLPPTGNNRSNKTKIIEENVYQLNQIKWEFAKKWCENKGIEFKIITETELYPFMSRQSVNKKIKK